jgi:wyosine [tRNA(Phe)-imidazoG37] synthetase (radical SAM superfamily)
MVNFSIETKNDFVLEILFVKDLNDKEDEIVLLYDAVKKINPKRVDIGTIDRPPAYDVKPVSYEFLESVADRFENINTNIIYKNRPKSIQYYDKDEIKSMLKRRPLTKEDIQNMFDEESKLILNDLLENKFISLVNSSGVEFYKNLQK